MGAAQNLEIDYRITPKEFMELLKCKKTKFYKRIQLGEIEKPHTDGKRTTFWYASYVKRVVESLKTPDE